MVAGGGIGMGDVFVVVACDLAGCSIAPLNREVVGIAAAQGQGDGLAVSGGAPYTETKSPKSGLVPALTSSRR